MDDWLRVHYQAYSKVYLIYGLVFAVNLGALVVLSISYCKSTYSLNLLEENDPDIDLTGLKGFSFDYYSNMEYTPGMSNLGTTGNIYLDCFTGSCKYKETYTCYKESCTGTGKNKKCHEYKTTCTRYSTQKEYSCSESCRLTKNSYCSRSSCPYISGVSYYSSSCSRDEDTKKIDSKQSCNADNLVMFWNNSYYRRSNRTDYKRFSYLNSAVTANESCPTGKKVCGILDNLGNKFCYPEFEDCPLNYITLDKSDSNYTLDNVTIGNKVIYYSNQATENGKIVGGLFVDSDLLIKYNEEDCEILDENSVLNLLNGHYNRLYRKSLSYDPYTSYTKEVQQGKSYLKWCVPGVGKEKNISKIKELNVVYQFNVTTNKDIIKPIKSMFTSSYFVALPGFIGMFFLLIIILFSFFEQNDINSNVGGFLRFSYTANFIFLICIGVSCILIIVSFILMFVNNGNIANATKLDLDVAIFKSLKTMNYVGIGVCIDLVVLIAIFVLYLFITPTTYIESPKPDVYHPIKDTYSTSNNAGTKTEDFKTSSDFNNTPTNNNNNNYNSSSDFNNNANTGYNLNNLNNNNNYNSSDFNNNAYTGYNSNTDFNNNNNNAGGYNSSDFGGYGGGGNIYAQPLNPSQQQSVY